MKQTKSRVWIFSFFVIILLFSTANRAHCQITWDTTMELSRHEGGYGTFKPSVKVAAFYSEGIGFEVVRVKNSLSLVWLMSNTATKYYGLQWTPNKNYKYGLTAIKIGGEVDFRFLHLGAALLSQTDYEKLKFYLSPEVGFSWWGTVCLYYVPLISLNNNDFEGVADYQVGLKYNFTKDLAKEFRKGTID